MNFAKLQRLGKTVGLCVALALSACGGGGGGNSPAPASPPAAVLAPSVPVITVNPASPAPKVQANFNAISTDPAGLALTYEWDFGDGSAKVTGASVQHAYASAASYVATAKVSNSGGVSVSSTKTVSVAVQMPTAPTISSSASPAATGQTISFTATATDPGGLALTYTWQFGDGTTATGNPVTHIYAVANSYAVTASASNGTLSSNGSFTQSILANTPNALVADCVGAGCGATNATTYSGSGVGVWKYANTSAVDASVDINISNVAAGKKATLLFSNGTLTAGTTKPSGGTLAEPGIWAEAKVFAPNAAASSSIEDINDTGHSRMQARNRDAAQKLKTLRTASASQPLAEASSTFTPTRRISAAPAVGATRSWNDTFPSPAVAYAVAVNQTCATANSRNVVFWLDPNALTSGNVTQTDMNTLAARFCGATGAFAQLTGLIGDAWGVAAQQKYSNVLNDAPLQDINVVILDVPTSSGWAGYFDGSNNLLKTSNADSNEAIAFNVNASQIKVAGVNFISSTLIHEATHMINFYQRSILKGNDHDTWLEETTAMMSEDTLSNSVFGAGVYNKISGRTNTYLATGGGVDYANWPTSLGNTTNYYNIGGAFGAYLNRRYGLAMVKGLSTNCNDGSSAGAVSSYACLDALIKTNGGAGFAEDYARFGASVFARIAPTTQPAGYGYPNKTDGGYTYSAFDLSLRTAPTPATLAGGLPATTHIFQTDTVAVGKTSYARTGMVVPANTTLIVVVQ